jgi:hypothetical protein
VFHQRIINGFCRRGTTANATLEQGAEDLDGLHVAPFARILDVADRRTGTNDSNAYEVRALRKFIEQ